MQTDIGRRRIGARTNRYQGDVVHRVANSTVGISDDARAVGDSKLHVGDFVHAIANSKFEVRDSNFHVGDLMQAIADSMHQVADSMLHIRHFKHAIANSTNEVMDSKRHVSNMKLHVRNMKPVPGTRTRQGFSCRARRHVHPGPLLIALALQAAQDCKRILSQGQRNNDAEPGLDDDHAGRRRRRRCVARPDRRTHQVHLAR